MEADAEAPRVAIGGKLIAPAIQHMIQKHIFEEKFITFQIHPSFTEFSERLEKPSKARTFDGLRQRSQRIYELEASIFFQKGRIYSPTGVSSD